MIAAALGGAILSPIQAAADPNLDLGVLQPVDPNRYGTYATYGAGGWQFVTPNGVRCRIMTVTRWGSASQATCWGANLPGISVGDNVNYAKAKGAYIDDPPQSTFGHADLDTFETYRSYEHRSTEEVDHVDPASYNPLPIGSKLTVDGTGAVVTCGLFAADRLSCTVSATVTPGWTTGFVLSPGGSRTFA